MCVCVWGGVTWAEGTHTRTHAEWSYRRRLMCILHCSSKVEIVVILASVFEVDYDVLMW